MTSTGRTDRAQRYGRIVLAPRLPRQHRAVAHVQQHVEHVRPVHDHVHGDRAQPPAGRVLRVPRNRDAVDLGATHVHRRWRRLRCGIRIGGRRRVNMPGNNGVLQLSGVAAVRLPAQRAGRGQLAAAIVDVRRMVGGVRRLRQQERAADETEEGGDSGRAGV